MRPGAFTERLCSFAKGFARIVSELDGYLHIISVDVSKILTCEKAKRGTRNEKIYYPFDIPPYFRWMCKHERNTATRVWGKTRCFQQRNPGTRPLTDGDVGVPFLENSRQIPSRRQLC